MSVKTANRRPVTPVHIVGSDADQTPMPVQLSGSSVDLRGLHANRPDADAVEPGTTYWSVDESEAPGTVFVSDGSTWTELIDLTE